LDHVREAATLLLQADSAVVALHGFGRVPADRARDHVPDLCQARRASVPGAIRPLEIAPGMPRCRDPNVARGAVASAPPGEADDRGNVLQLEWSVVPGKLPRE
jgi:hypothetical protein